MFWGLIMEPNKRYTQTVEKPFHISQAAMDTSTGDGEMCQVMVVVDGKNFLVCTLQKNKTIQVPLDLYFKTGNVVSFLTNGKSHIHLTGYLDPEFDDELSEGEEEEDEAPELVPAKGKRKLEAASESSAKKLKQEAQKLLKAEDSDDDDEEDDDDDEEAEDEEDDDSSDEADDLQKLLQGDVDSDENDDSFRPNSTGADSEDDSEEEEENTTLNTTSEADISKEEPKKLSKSQKRKLKKQQKEQEGKPQKEQVGKPQTNGVDKKAAKKEQVKGQEQKQKVKEAAAADIKPAGGEKREKKTLSGGVFIEDLKVGNGPAAKPGKQIEVYYEGRLKQNNKMFDSCNKGPGFKFRVGHKEVIPGWDVGISGMKVGGKRKIVCPPGMAYGNKGSPPVIPPNSTLVFEVELRKVK